MTTRLVSNSFLTLKVRAGGRKIRLHGKNFRVGRAPQCEVVVEGPRVSRLHARLVLKETQWFVEDLDSANGVFLNGRKVKCEELHPGDLLEFGVRGPEVEVRDLAPQTQLRLETATEF